VIDNQNSFAQERNHFASIILKEKAVSASLDRENALRRSDKEKDLPVLCGKCAIRQNMQWKSKTLVLLKIIYSNKLKQLGMHKKISL